MATVVPNPKSIRPFVSADAFYAWLSKEHARQSEVWIKIFKKGSGKPSITAAEGIEVSLCWGWIDGIRKSFDEEAFLQRYTPRKAKSRWSQINVEKVAQLIKAGRMSEPGQREIDAAKADGRWAAAYPPPSKIEIAPDALAAIEKQPRARAAFRALNRANVYALAYRLHHVAPSKRAQLIDKVVAMLARGETHHPNGSPAKTSNAAAPGKKKPAPVKTARPRAKTGTPRAR